MEERRKERSSRAGGVGPAVSGGRGQQDLSLKHDHSSLGAWGTAWLSGWPLLEVRPSISGQGLILNRAGGGVNSCGSEPQCPGWADPCAPSLRTVVCSKRFHSCGVPREEFKHTENPRADK